MLKQGFKIFWKIRENNAFSQFSYEMVCRFSKIPRHPQAHPTPGPPLLGRPIKVFTRTEILRGRWNLYVLGIFQWRRQDFLFRGCRTANKMLSRAPCRGRTGMVTKLKNFKGISIIENESIFQNFNFSGPKNLLF